MIPAADIAVCIGFRNWHVSHLDRCLASLLAQTGARFAEVSLVDLGSDGTALQDEILIASQYGVSVLLASRAEWSRSVALNMAARHSSASWLLFTDADMIFPEEYIVRVFGLILAEDTLYLTRSRDFGHPSIYDGSVWDPPHTLAKLRGLTTPHDDVGQGGGMLVPREWFEKVGGFDEFYSVWGAEDNDLVLRAQWNGLRVEWLPDVFVAHQWHRRDWPTLAQFAQVQRNRAYLAERIVEQELGWPAIIRNANPTTLWCCG